MVPVRKVQSASATGHRHAADHERGDGVAYDHGSEEQRHDGQHERDGRAGAEALTGGERARGDDEGTRNPDRRLVVVHEQQERRQDEGGGQRMPDQQVVDILGSTATPRVSMPTPTRSPTRPVPVIMDAVWRPIANAVMSPVFGPLIGDLDNVRDLDGLEGESYVDKDLRRLLGNLVVGPFNLSYCGLGSLMPCVDSLWQAIHQTADTLTTQQGQVDPSLWRKTASTTGFVPGLLPNRFPTTNRPTAGVPGGIDASAIAPAAAGRRRHLHVDLLE